MGESKQIIWSGVQVVSVKGASFIFSILMARFVAPEAYGLIAMVTVFIAFFQLFVDSGLGNALIQKKDKSEIDYHTTYSSNMTISIFLYGVMFFCAPFISDFYNQPELTSVVRWLSLTLIIQSTYLVQKCRLTINIDFKKQAKAGVYSTLISGVIGIIFAYFNFQVWALVIQTLSSQVILSILLIAYAKWYPKFNFSISSFKALFRFGSRDLVGNMFTSFFININNLFIGKFYSPSGLAYYNRGFNLGFMPAAMIQETISRISYPVQCKYQDDKDKLLGSFYRYIGLSAFVTFPVMMLLVIFAKPTILILLTSKWEGAISFTQIMALAFMTFPSNVIISQILNAIGRPGLNTKAVLVKRIISFIILIITVFISVKAIAWGICIGNLIEISISIWLSARVIKISVFSIIKPMLKPLLATILMGLMCSGYYLLVDNLYINLFGGVLVGFLSYICISYLLKIEECAIFDKIIGRFKR